jgi:hypothetical protein
MKITDICFETADHTPANLPTSVDIPDADVERTDDPTHLHLRITKWLEHETGWLVKSYVRDGVEYVDTFTLWRSVINRVLTASRSTDPIERYPASIAARLNGEYDIQARGQSGVKLYDRCVVAS